MDEDYPADEPIPLLPVSMRDSETPHGWMPSCVRGDPVRTWCMTHMGYVDKWLREQEDAEAAVTAELEAKYASKYTLDNAARLAVQAPTRIVKDFVAYYQICWIQAGPGGSTCDRVLAHEGPHTWELAAAAVGEASHDATP